MDDEDICYCGHTFGEHETGFYKPCAVEGCDCHDFEYDEDTDDGDRW